MLGCYPGGKVAQQISEELGSEIYLRGRHAVLSEVAQGKARPGSRNRLLEATIRPLQLSVRGNK